MSKVDRLDFNAPPPGIWGEYDFGNERMVYFKDRTANASASCAEHGENAIDVAFKDSWAHYKARHDPPGMWSGYCAVLPLCDQYRPRMGVSVPGVAHLELYVNAERPNSPEEARLHGRAAAWLVYEDAVEVADLLDHDRSPVGHRDVWPRPLAWTAEERAAVKWWVNWHIKTGQKVARPPALPEVLRAL